MQPTARIGHEIDRALAEGYEFCARYTEGKQVLEVPCRCASGSAVLHGCASTTGIEADRLPTSGFDAVVSVRGLQHLTLSNARKFMSQAWRVLRDEGTIVLIVPSCRPGTRCGPDGMFDYTAPILRAVAAPYFCETRVEECAGAAGPELRFVGRRRPAIDSGAERDASLQRALQDLSGTLHGVLPPPEIRGSSNIDALFERCAVIGLAWNEGRLEGYTTEQRRRWAAEIQELLSGDKPVNSRSAHHLDRLAIAANTLRLLGERAPTFLPREFLDEKAVSHWLDALDWNDPACASSSIASLFALLIHAREMEDERRAAEVYHFVLDSLDRRQNQNTGFWSRGDADPLSGVIAAGRLMAFYQYVHRPMMCMRKLVDAALSIEVPDVHRTYLLAAAACSTPYRKEEISRVLIGQFWSAWNGGSDGSASSLWHRLATIETIALAFPEELPAWTRWQPTPWPGTGYFQQGCSKVDRESLRGWMREPACGSTRFKANAEVAVIVTCFNLGQYLFESLDSVARQTLADIRVTVYDDGSTDEFTKLYLEFLAERGFEVVRAENRGLAAARNAAIAACPARYICTLDADDRLDPAYLGRAIEVLNSDPEGGFVSCFYRTFDNENAVYRYDRCRLPEMLVQNEAAVVSVFRREAWEKAGGYCCELDGMEDWEFWISILEKGYRGATIPEVLFHYRSRIGSMYSSTRKPSTYVDNMRIITRRHRALFEANWEAVLERKTRQFAELLEARSAELAAHERQLAAIQAASRAEIGRLNELIEAMRRTRAWRAAELLTRIRRKFATPEQGARRDKHGA